MSLFKKGYHPERKKIQIRKSSMDAKNDCDSDGFYLWDGFCIEIGVTEKEKSSINL